MVLALLGLPARMGSRLLSNLQPKSCDCRHVGDGYTGYTGYNSDITRHLVKEGAGYTRLQVATLSLGPIPTASQASLGLSLCPGRDTRIGVLHERCQAAVGDLTVVGKEEPDGRIGMRGEDGFDAVDVAAGEVVQVLGQLLGDGGIGGGLHGQSPCRRAAARGCQLQPGPFHGAIRSHSPDRVVVSSVKAVLTETSVILPT